MQELLSRRRFPCGAWPLADQGTHFRVWAPNCRQVSVELVSPGHARIRELAAETDAAGRRSGYFSAVWENVAAGACYRLQLDGGPKLPDPVSRFQPHGVHGPSQVIDPFAYCWHDHAWRGISREQLVIYELHVGTFTEAGTFRAAVALLDELLALGVTCVELMPVVPAPGRWNWGYDGVDLFAVRETYGTPEELKAFVDAAHARGLAVILDVVYNHLGPEGNYLSQFGPYFSTDYDSPWGPAFDFDGPHAQPVRDYVIANALMWLEEYHIDGLRLDAIQFMFDDRPQPITHELSDAVRELEQHAGRPFLLVGETNVFEEELLAPRQEGGAGFDAIWCDDFLHSLGGMLTGQQLTPRTFAGAADVAAVLEQGALYEGPPGGRIRLQRPRRLDLTRLVWSIQNHDFVGNHPLGHRLTMQTTPAAHRAAAALLLLSPAIPLLFMGEEFATSAPFHFFADFGDAHLREAVIAGRRAEHPEHLGEAAVCPTSEEAFTLSRPGHISSGDAAMVRWYHDLLECRRQWREAGLLSPDLLQVACDVEQHLYTLQYADQKGQSVFVAVRVSPPRVAAEAVNLSLDGEVLLHSEWTDYGGQSAPEEAGLRNVLLELNAAIIGRGRISLTPDRSRGA